MPSIREGHTSSRAGARSAESEYVDATYVNVKGQTSVQGLPLFKPPWGQITAIDLNKGSFVWQIAHGETPDNIRNHSALKGLNILRTGRQGRIGTLVTRMAEELGEPSGVSRRVIQT